LLSPADQDHTPAQATQAAPLAHAAKSQATSTTLQGQSSINTRYCFTQLIKTLGDGTFGRVVEATHIPTGRSCALKVKSLQDTQAN
jgi:hypothetical protein